MTGARPDPREDPVAAPEPSPFSTTDLRSSAVTHDAHGRPIGAPRTEWAPAAPGKPLTLPAREAAAVGTVLAWVATLLLVVAAHHGRDWLTFALVTIGGVSFTVAGCATGDKSLVGRAVNVAAVVLVAAALGAWTAATVLHVTAP